MDRRQFGRRESAIHAVALISGRAPAHCIVRNFSERGALLEFKEATVPPFRFRLVIEAKKVDLMCEVRHQGQHGVGVFFVSGSADGLFDGYKLPPAPNSLPPRANSERMSRQPARISGSDLRTAMFGAQQKQDVAEIVRAYDPDAGGIIRGSRTA